MRGIGANGPGEGGRLATGKGVDGYQIIKMSRCSMICGRTASLGRLALPPGVTKVSGPRLFGASSTCPQPRAPIWYSTNSATTLCPRRLSLIQIGVSRIRRRQLILAGQAPILLVHNLELRLRDTTFATASSRHSRPSELDLAELDLSEAAPGRWAGC